MAALLLDENMPRSMGRALAEAGHDVVFAADTQPSAEDQNVLALARAGQRILVSFDADFGDLVYQRGMPAPPAIIYLRMHPIDAAIASEMVTQALAETVAGQFVVCTRQGRRSRALPKPAAGSG
jgi:predicted nuclease of predicted toxin-antitoxin system